MTHPFRSAPRGDRLVGWFDWLVTLLAAWLVPAGAGLALLALAMLFGVEGAPADAIGGPTVLLAMHGVGWLLALSPVLSWLGLALVGPALWLLLRLGLAGWLSVAAAGAAVGLLAGSLIQGFAAMVGVPFGAAAGLIWHATLARLAPAALAPGDRTPR